MYRIIAHVEDGRLYQSQTENNPIAVGTQAWFDWLEQHHVFLFVDRMGRFIAYKSYTDHDGQNWDATRTRNDKRYHVRLGQSQALTLERLQVAAQTLAGEYAPLKPSDVGQVASTASTEVVRKAAATSGSPSSLIHTKLYRPRRGSDVIPRARLMECLNAALGGKATLVCAPAGFGKTTLVAEWVQTIERSTAWLSLDEHDNELAVFVISLTAALQTVFPDAFGAITSLLSAPQFPSLHRIAILLSNDLAALPEDIVLVLDDYHSIRNGDIHTLLEGLITYLPPQVHLVLVTRFEPPLPLATWLAKGYLNTLSYADLRFTLEETEAFLTLVLGNETAHETAGALEERTEGWIAALRLAALALRSTPDHAAFLDLLASSPPRSLSRYLSEEILLQQTPAVQQLLERLSLFERFSVDACVALLEGQASPAWVRATLQWLQRSNLFLIPLDEYEEWYRLHHLFQQFLRLRLQSHSSPAELASLHRRASAWFADQGFIEEALLHALAAGDAPHAAKLVEARFHWAFEQEEWVLMERWLRLLPEVQVQSSPCLLLARAWILQFHGQVADLPRLLEVVERLLVSSDSDMQERADSLHGFLHAAAAISWCQFQYFTGRAQASLESAERALRWNPPGEEYLASLASMYLALSQQATGHEVVALVTLQEALLDHATQRSSTLRLLFAQALVFLAAGKLHQVEHVASHFLKLARQANLVMSQYWAHWFLGMVQYEWNNLDAAASHFSVVVANQHQAHSWAVQEALYGLAFAYQAQGLEAESQKAARALFDFVQEQHCQRDLLTAYAFYGQLALLQNGVEASEPWLGMAGEQEELVGPMTSLEVLDVTRAWMLLAKGGDANVAQGQAILTRLLPYVEAIHSTRKTIQVLALQAWAYDLQGREAEALNALERALVLARPGGFIRTFADLPALFRLLQELRTRGGKQQSVDQKDAYVKRVLVAINPVAARAVLREDLLRQEGLEP